MTTPDPTKKKLPVRKPAQPSLLKGFISTDADVNAAASMKNEEPKKLQSFSKNVTTKACPDNKGSFDLLVGGKVIAYVLDKRNGDWIAFHKKEGQKTEGTKIGVFGAKDNAIEAALRRTGHDDEVIYLKEANGIYSPVTDAEIAADNTHLERRGGKLVRGQNGSFRVITDGDKTLKQSAKKAIPTREAVYAVFDKDTEEMLSHTTFSGSNAKRDAQREVDRIWSNSFAYARKFTAADYKRIHGKDMPADYLKEAEEKRAFRRGDVVEVTKEGNKYEGATGEVDEIGGNGKLISVDLYNHGKHPFHAGDLTLSDTGAEEENADAKKFYVAFYDKDEERSWVGVVTKENGGKWHEKQFRGKPGHRWGASHESYLTPPQIMSWIHKDYPRSIDIEGPFMSSEEAENYVTGNWGSLQESRLNEGLRHLDTEESADNRVVGKIYYDSANREYIVKYYVDGKYAGDDACTHDDNRGDAEDTAKAEVKFMAKRLPALVEGDDASKTHKLVHEDSGEEVKLPATLKDFRGDKVRVISFTPPHKPDASGYIYTKDGSRYYPSVVDCKIVARDKVAEEQLDEISQDRLELMHKQVDKALASPDPKVRATAFATRHATPAHITKGLNDEDVEVRVAAASHENIVGRQLARAASDENIRVRRAAQTHRKAGADTLGKGAADHFMAVARHGKGGLDSRGVREGVMKKYSLSVEPEEYEEWKTQGKGGMWLHTYNPKSHTLTVETDKPKDLAVSLEKYIEFGATSAYEVLGLREGLSVSTMSFAEYLAESKTDDELRKRAFALANKMLGTDETIKTPIVSKRSHPELEEVSHKFLDTKGGQWVARKMKCKKTGNECVQFQPPRGHMAPEFYIKPRKAAEAETEE